MRGCIPEVIVSNLYEIIRIKAPGKEKEPVKNIGVMDRFVEQFLEDTSETPQDTFYPSIDVLNAELQRIILIYSEKK